jgi:DNA replication protein DnaD
VPVSAARWKKRNIKTISKIISDEKEKTKKKQYKTRRTRTKK